MDNKKNMYIILTVLCVAVISLSVAFAALTTTLTINFGNVTQTVQTWNVLFEANTSIAIDSTKSYSTSATGYSCGTAAATATAVTVGNTSLSKPGDVCTWKVKVKNTGSINARLSTVTANSTAPTVSSGSCTASDNNLTITCGSITFKLAKAVTVPTTIAGATAPTVTLIDLNNASSDIAGGGSKDMYLVAYYNNDTAVTNSAYTATGVNYKLNYVQK